MFLESQQVYKSVSPIRRINLPEFVVLTGLNGSGKTHLLQGINVDEIALLDDSAQRFRLAHVGPHAARIIKLVAYDTFAPSNGSTVSRETLLKQAEFLLRQFHTYKSHKLTNPSLRQGHFENTTLRTLERIAASAKKDIDSLKDDDILRYYPSQDDRGDILGQNLSAIFKRYQLKHLDNAVREVQSRTDPTITYLSDAEFRKLERDQPWKLFNSIVDQAQLDYEITNPSGDLDATPFHAKLINKINHAEIDFSDLSGGEKTIMSLALALYNSHFEAEFPRVLLMDEPDAHLHPSLTKQFLDVIRNIFVRDKGVKVIITTHSPSTVALAPEESIFVMNKTEPRIVKATKDEALSILTSGVPTLSIDYENRRQVFVESKHDVRVYEIAYNKLKDKLVSEISINFISSGTSGSGNSDQVRTIVNKLALEFGNRSIYGIIDWDLNNIGNEHVKVLGRNQRYSIENYVLDPLLLSSFLLRDKIIERATFGLSESETYMNLPRFDNERLQAIAHRTLALIKPHFADSQDESTVGADYVGGRHIDLPMWFCKAQGHELEESVKKTFKQLNKYGENLKLEIMRKVVDDMPGLLSSDFFRMFRDIQNYQPAASGTLA